MASLLDLTVQGDVGTITDESQLPKIKLMGPLELYRLWERQGWVSHAISLEQDRRDWESMDENAAAARIKAGAPIRPPASRSVPRRA